jgi:hypothetical protein
MHSEFAYGTTIADQLFCDLYENEMRVGEHRLIGILCREGFVARLAELLEVEVSNGMVDKVTLPKVDGRAGIVQVPENLPQGCVTAMGISMRGHTRCSIK